MYFFNPVRYDYIHPHRCLPLTAHSRAKNKNNQLIDDPTDNGGNGGPPKYYQIIRLTEKDPALINHIVNTLAGTQQFRQDGKTKTSLITSWHSRWHHQHWFVLQHLNEKKKKKKKAKDKDDNKDDDEDDEDDNDDDNDGDDDPESTLDQLDPDMEWGSQFVKTHIDQFIKSNYMHLPS